MSRPENNPHTEYARRFGRARALRRLSDYTHEERTQYESLGFGCLVAVLLFLALAGLYIFRQPDFLWPGQ